MRIELVKPWGFAAPGQVIDPAPGVAQLLIERGIAKPVEEKQAFSDRWNKRESRPPQPRQEVARGRK